jgi:hypothetical protein
MTLLISCGLPTMYFHMHMQLFFIVKKNSSIIRCKIDPCLFVLAFSVILSNALIHLYMKWKYTNLKSRSTPPERLYTFFAHLCRKWGTPARWLTAIEVHISYSGYSRWRVSLYHIPQTIKTLQSNIPHGHAGQLPGAHRALCSQE